MIEFLTLVLIAVVIYHIIKKVDAERERAAFVKEVLRTIDHLPVLKEEQYDTGDWGTSQGPEGPDGKPDDKEDL